MSNLADFHSPFNNQYLLILQEAQCKFDGVYYHFLYFFCFVCCVYRNKSLNLHNKGEMVEWSITAVLKTAVPRGTGGSNPSLSAKSDVTS